MRVVINGKLYDSTVIPVLLIFDENEKEIFNMNRFVSSPASYTEEEREALIKTNLNDVLASQNTDSYYSKIEEPCFVCDCEDALNQERGTQSHPINCGWRVKRENKGYSQGLNDIVKICDNILPDSVELSDLLNKIKNTALASLFGGYDLKEGESG